MQSLDGQQHVLAFLYRAHAKHITVGQHVFVAHHPHFRGSRRLGETWGTALIDDVYALWVNIAQFADVTFCALADGHYAVGLIDGVKKFLGVDLHVSTVVIFRMAHEDQIVNGDDRTDARLADAYGQLAREPMIDIDAVFQQLFDDAVRAPQRLADGGVCVAGIAEGYVGPPHNLRAQLRNAVVGRIEAQVEGIERRQIINKRAPIIAQARAVAHNALRIKADNHPVCHNWLQRYEEANEKQKKTTIFFTFLSGSTFGAASGMKLFIIRNS